ncbi:MAG: cysteine peptidase family C39 domain-containing protein, partial [bacterium]
MTKKLLGAILGLFISCCLLNPLYCDAKHILEENVDLLIKAVEEREKGIRDIKARIRWEENKETGKIQAFIKRVAGGVGVSESKKRKIAQSKGNTYLWWMKEGKMRLDLLHEQEKAKTLAIFDGEKTYNYLYRPDDEAKLGQVHINKAPYPYFTGEVLSIDYPLVLLGLYLQRKPLSKLLKEGEVSFIGKENLKGEECYIYEVSWENEIGMENGEKLVEKCKIRLWAAPSKGFVILKRADFSPSDNQISYTLEVDRLEKFSENLWLPRRAVGTLFLPNEKGKREPAIKRSFEFEELIVNSGLDDALFKPNLPRGTFIYEIQTGRFYQIGKEASDEDVIKRAETVKKFLRKELRAKDLEKLFPPLEGIRFDYNCGPYALLFICSVFDIKTSSDELAKLAQADEKGFTTLAGLKQAAEAKGLKAEGVDITLEELRKELEKNKLAIAYISFEHFIAIAGFEENKAIVLDPPTMLVVTPLYALDEVWD